MAGQSCSRDFEDELVVVVVLSSSAAGVSDGCIAGAGVAVGGGLVEDNGDGEAIDRSPVGLGISVGLVVGVAVSHRNVNCSSSCRSPSGKA